MLGNVMVFKLTQFSKVLDPKSCISEVKITFFRFLQSMKEQRPKATQPLIFTVVRLLQFSKAYQPICLTEEGIKISFKLTQLLKTED